MQSYVHKVGVSLAVVFATALGLHLLGFSPWTGDPAANLIDYLAVIGVAGLCNLLDPPRLVADPGATMRLSFVGEFTALIFFGPIPMTLTATIGALARAYAEPHGSQALRRMILDLITACAATQAAGLAHTMLGGAPAPLAWPGQGMPLAGSVVAYCFITCAVADVIAPLASTVAAPHNWPRQAFRGCPGHFIGAAIALAIIELVEHRAWNLVPIAAVPLYFAWDAYRTHAERVGREDRRLDAGLSADHGICVVDDKERIIRWSDSVAQFLECPRSRAVGAHLAEAVPALAHSAVPVAIREAIATRSARTLEGVTFNGATSDRVLDVTIIPDGEGIVLVWRDVTEHAGMTNALRVDAARFAIVAKGANDGIWELDETSRTVFQSLRLREILGLSTTDGPLARDTWFALVHPDDLDAFRKMLESVIRGRTERAGLEHRIRHSDGTWRRVQTRCMAARDASGRPTRVIGSMTDVTESAMAREQIENAGSRDPLTGLLNRVAFVERLGRRLQELREGRRGGFAVLYLDLDRFKVVNDSLGHLVGDELLVGVSRKLEACLRPGDVIARLGGDEFAVMLQSIMDGTQANVVAFRVQEALQSPFPIGGREVVTSASIGIAISRLEYTNPEEIMRDADTAMYHAKSHGKARHELFDADMHAKALDRLGLESDLRHAIKSNAFEVHYQPIVSLHSRKCTGFESLVRWNRNGKPVSPAEFVPVAEELGIIEPMGTWVMQEACAKFVEWKARYPEAGLECITVNVSARQLVQQGFVYLVEQTVEQNDMDPADLRLEITETALMDAPQSAAKVLAELREYGVKIYLDDFGTGYSSLSHLHKLPVDALKIDRSFVNGLLLDDRPAIVESILALARTLKTNVVAEGIEEEQQAMELERLGCRQAQGFYFSRPVPAERIEEILRSGAPLGGRRAAPAPSMIKPVKREIA